MDCITAFFESLKLLFLKLSSPFSSFNIQSAETFKLTVDILSSIASIVAIATVLYAWWSAKKKPLKVSYFNVIPTNDGMYQYYFEIQNIRNYPITIYNLLFYSGYTVIVNKELNRLPQYRKVLESDRLLFNIEETAKIGEFGVFKPVPFITKIGSEELKSVVALIYTSHGRLELEFNNVLISSPLRPMNSEFMEIAEGKRQVYLKMIKGYLLYILSFIPGYSYVRKIILRK